MTMQRAILEIRDSCRENLSPYTARAYGCLPAIEKPRIADIGCGTGEPTLVLAKISNGTILAVDPDGESCALLREKIMTKGYEQRITVLQSPLQSAGIQRHYFDIVWAEGLLNVIGFEEGLSYAGALLKDNGYFVIHDDLSAQDDKKKLIEKNRYALCDTFQLDEAAWPGYFNCLEKHVTAYMETHALSGAEAELFNKELRDIRSYRTDPLNLRSVFYILKKKAAA